MRAKKGQMGIIYGHEKSDVVMCGERDERTSERRIRKNEKKELVPGHAHTAQKEGWTKWVNITRNNNNNNNNIVVYRLPPPSSDENALSHDFWIHTTITSYYAHTPHHHHHHILFIHPGRIYIILLLYRTHSDLVML